MVSERCRPLLSRMNGVFAPFPCIQSSHTSASQHITPQARVCSPVFCLPQRSTDYKHCISSRMGVRTRDEDSARNAGGKGRTPHRAGGAIQPYNLSGTLYPLQAARKCSVPEGSDGTCVHICLHLTELLHPPGARTSCILGLGERLMRGLAEWGWLTSRYFSSSRLQHASKTTCILMKACVGPTLTPLSFCGSTTQAWRFKS